MSKIVINYILCFVFCVLLNSLHAQQEGTYPGLGIHYYKVIIQKDDAKNQALLKAQLNALINSGMYAEIEYEGEEIENIDKIKEYKSNKIKIKGGYGSETFIFKNLLSKGIVKTIGEPDYNDCEKGDEFFCIEVNGKFKVKNLQDILKDTPKRERYTNCDVSNDMLKSIIKEIKSEKKSERLKTAKKLISKNKCFTTKQISRILITFEEKSSDIYSLAIYAYEYTKDIENYYKLLFTNKENSSIFFSKTDRINFIKFVGETFFEDCNIKETVDFINNKLLSATGRYHAFQIDDSGQITGNYYKNDTNYIIKYNINDIYKIRYDYFNGKFVVICNNCIEVYRKQDNYTNIYKTSSYLTYRYKSKYYAAFVSYAFRRLKKIFSK